MYFLNGIDEAGLGPILGPYCAARTRFKADSDINIFDKLSYIITKDPQEKEKIAVNDSKILYKPRTGLSVLEETVMIFIQMLKKTLPATFLEFLHLLACPADIEKLKDVPWFAAPETLSLPIKADTGRIDKKYRILHEGMSRANLGFSEINLRIVPAVEFNRLLDLFLSKSDACLNILTPLIAGAAGSPGKTIIDRQGARKYYGTRLVNILPGERLKAGEETKNRSVYFTKNNRLEFLVKADSLCFETALASCFAKYTRECCMMLFNRYWRTKAPELKPTAGYPKDGKRFISNLKRMNLLPENMEMLVRKR